MPAPKGHPRYGGRAKGVLNKGRQELLDICAKHKCNPFEGMVILAMKERDPDKQFDKFDRIASYVIPKCKAIEISENPDAPLGSGLDEKQLKVAGAYFDSMSERKRGK